MSLTAEQKKAVRYDDNLMLTACPGSGKTRVIISKLSRSIDEVRNTPRSVGCITYTNAAVYEIEARLRQHVQPGDDLYYDICTIHSFCLNHIFRPFCHLIKGYENGFKVLTPDSDEFENHVSAICAEYGIYNLDFFEKQEFAQLRIGLDGEPIRNGIEHGLLTPDIIKSYWNRIRREGLIDFANIIYHSLKLLQERQEILSYVASKFAWILVDEFQDTSDLQVEILSHIAKICRTRFFLVGDPYQSIFRFAGARPDLAEEFADRINARKDMTLSSNFRSSPPILAQADLLLPRTAPMEALGPARSFTEVPYWQHGSDAFEVIADYFLPGIEGMGIPLGEAAILAPAWYLLFPLGRRLRKYGISVVGPGARPYRRNRYFAPIAEKICGYLMEPRPDAIPGIERTLFQTLLDLTGRANFDVFSYRGRVLIFHLLYQARQLHVIHTEAVSWLEEASKLFSQVLADEEYLSPKEQTLLVMSVDQMKMDMQKNRVDLANLSIDDLGVYASPESALKLSTLHNAKGREYQAVAIIGLHEGILPYYQANTAEDLEEAKRLFYVGITRAKRFLLYITDDTLGRRGGPCRFLCDGAGIRVCPGTFYP